MRRLSPDHWRRVVTMYADTYNNRPGAKEELPIETDTEKSGWGLFSGDLGIFLSDFFATQLNGEQKLIFYSYYVTDMTLSEIAERFDCSHQAIHRKIVNMNNMMKHCWKYADRWR